MRGGDGNRGQAATHVENAIPGALKALLKEPVRSSWHRPNVGKTGRNLYGYSPFHFQVTNIQIAYFESKKSDKSFQDFFAQNRLTFRLKSHISMPLNDLNSTKKRIAPSELHEILAYLRQSSYFRINVCQWNDDSTHSHSK